VERQVLAERVEHRVQVGLLVLRVLVVFQEHQERVERQVRVVRLEHQVQLVLQVLVDYLVKLVLAVRQERVGHRER